MSQIALTESIYKSRNVLMEIFGNQGYDISEYKEFSISDIHHMIQNKQLDLLINNPTSQKKCYIKYHLGRTLRPNNIQEIIDDLFNLENILNKSDDLIIILKEDINETIQRFLVDCWENENIFIRILPLKRIQYNILNHELVPNHRILKDKEEIEQFLIKYNINKDNITKEIPDISRFSPVSLLIGIRPKEICEIDRKSKTSISSFYYRICL